MAQGNIRAFHFPAGATVPLDRLVRRGTAHSALAHESAGDGRLVPTPVVPALRVSGPGLSGQALAGTGALVWEGELLEDLPVRRPGRFHTH